MVELVRERTLLPQWSRARIPNTLAKRKSHKPATGRLVSTAKWRKFSKFLEKGGAFNKSLGNMLFYFCCSRY